MSDWRKHLGKRETVALPYFGGGRVRMREREVRLAERPRAPGWYTFTIEGRSAKPGGPAEPELTGLAKVRGVLAYGALFAANAPPENVSFLPDDEPPLFASCTCFRWHDDELVFGELDFEGESEELARIAFAERRGLAEEKGISAPLRAAFAWATVKRTSREADIPCSAREAWQHARDVAERGDVAARELLERLEDLRVGRRIVVGGARIGVRAVLARAERARGAATLENAEERAEAALDAAGGRLRAVRRLAGGRQLEVKFDFGGEHFVTIADALTLQIVDAGICLVDHGDGHRGDAELTLESLPSAIREAMDLGALVITRR